MTNSPRYIESDNLSAAWAAALHACTSAPKHELAPLVVSITGFKSDGHPVEDEDMRKVLDRALEAQGKGTTETVANTLFPFYMWNPARPRNELFSRYNALLPRIRKASIQNRRGVYFERLINGGPDANRNQLDHVLSTWRPKFRRGVLQLSVFDGKRDHSKAAQLGFPCLQHVTFAPIGEDGLNVNAFYATQYLVDRAYGNYLGLCHLGMFVAHELNRSLTRMTCVTGIASLGPSAKRPLLDAIQRRMGGLVKSAHVVCAP